MEESKEVEGLDRKHRGGHDLRRLCAGASSEELRDLVLRSATVFANSEGRGMKTEL